MIILLPAVYRQIKGALPLMNHKIINGEKCALQSILPLIIYLIVVTERQSTCHIQGYGVCRWLLITKET